MPMKGQVCARRLILAGGIAALSIASCGCWNAAEAERQPVFPARGKVSVNGRPAENALVVFHPTHSNSTIALRPSGRTAPDGSFILSTYESGDGGPAGEYIVTISWPELPSGPNPDTDLAPDRLKGRYADPARSKLRARLAEQENLLPAFDLK